MNEMDKHFLVYDRPHVYKCSCGVVAWMTVLDGKADMKIDTMPKHIEYQPCGHAVCGKTPEGFCMICRMVGEP